MIRVTPDCVKPPGLREAKKEQTRSALSDAALELVSHHGYEATTVDAIARRAGVSVRTFHNYFPGKAAVLAHLAADLIVEYSTELRSQPDSVSCAYALRGAWLAMLSRHRSNEASLSALVDAIESNPDLRHYLEDAHPEASSQGVAEVARRLHLDPATSPVPRVVNEIAFSLTVTVIRVRANGQYPEHTLDQLLDEAFSALPLLVATPDTTR